MKQNNICNEQAHNFNSYHKNTTSVVPSLLQLYLYAVQNLSQQIDARGGARPALRRRRENHATTLAPCKGMSFHRSNTATFQPMDNPPNPQTQTSPLEVPPLIAPPSGVVVGMDQFNILVQQVRDLTAAVQII